MSIIPAIKSRGPEGSETYDLFSLLIKERIIFITGEINDEMAEVITAELLYLESKDDSLIRIYINSPGGSVSSGLAIFDVMKGIECPVETVGMGLCASMGAFLLAAGTKGHRKAYPNTEIMIHQPLGETKGQVTDLEIMTKQFIYLKKKMNNYLSLATNQPLEKISKDTERDFFMGAIEAKEYGIIDEVINLKTT